jgi:hypothetical protein
MPKPKLLMPGRKVMKTTGPSTTPVETSRRDCEPDNESRPREVRVRERMGPPPERMPRRTTYFYHGKVDRVPLTPAATELLAELLRREMFWHLVKGGRVDITFAGKAILGVDRQRSRDIINELDRDGGPCGWIRARFISGLSRGSIRPGFETRPSAIATAFFASLVGGWGQVSEIRDSLGPGERIDILEATERLSQIERHVARYFCVRGYWTPET